MTAERTTRLSIPEDPMSVDWRSHITSDPDVLDGKPIVEGTRLSVEFILGLFAKGWTEEQVLESYPGLSEESLRAVFAYAAEALGEESIHTLKSANG